MYGNPLLALFAAGGVGQAIRGIRRAAPPKNVDKRVAFYQKQAEVERKAAKRARKLGLKKLAEKHEAKALEFEQLAQGILRQSLTRPGSPTTGIRSLQMGVKGALAIPQRGVPGGFQTGTEFDASMPDPAAGGGEMTSVDTAMTPSYARPAALLLGVVVLGGGGYYLYKRSKKKG